MALLCNNISHWLGASLESALNYSLTWKTHITPIDSPVESPVQQRQCSPTKGTYTWPTVLAAAPLPTQLSWLEDEMWHYRENIPAPYYVKEILELLELLGFEHHWHEIHILSINDKNYFLQNFCWNWYHFIQENALKDHMHNKQYLRTDVKNMHWSSVLYETRYVDGTPTSEVTPVTIRYIHPPHHGHTSQYHGHEWMTRILFVHCQ